MKKKNLIPLLGVVGSGALSFLLIHFWLANFYASFMQISPRTAYWSLVTLLVLFSVWRAIQILREKDDATKMIDRWLDK